ncbi:hypothetical protein [Planctobacterium marinum]|uniref:Uncharacterized protein n=1 Tax=Planctobacterium marinum TaxID=1631968 RepID=A0AA48KTZ4_9ALTE|nr:hypothetical protein MACH26_35800 [Planctobacterium marinum]
MKNILVTDIFGKTRATEAMAQDFGHQCEVYTNSNKHLPSSVGDEKHLDQADV